MNTLLKIVLPLSMIALMATGWFYVQQSKNSQEADAMRTDLIVLKMKSEADELFILGNLNEALTLYRAIDSLTGDSLQARRLENPGKHLSTESNKLLTLSRNLERATAQLHEYQAKEQQSEDDGEEVVLDKPNELEEETRSLKENLMAAEREIESIKKSQGVIRFSSSKNGSVTYLGELRNGKANGTGFGHWTSGSHYEGEWKDNLRHGKGVFVWADGEKYEGEYRNDQRHGFGIYTAKVGKYEGNWHDDMRHGEGKLYEAHGKLKVHGVWEKDRLIKTLK
jgi:hypothetical protein